MKTIVIAAGGTGGHISPGVALAEALMQNKEKYGFEKLYIHSLNRNRDNPDLKSAPCELIWHNSPPITKMFFLFPFPFIYNLIKTILRFQKEKVDCVISMGGYSSVPALLYALFFRKKIFLCEQNRVIGKVNRIFLKYANKIAFSFPPITQKEIRVPHIVAGNPIRSKILPESKTKEFPKSPEERIHVLVMGGSQGARQINNMVLNSMENPEISKNFLFRILTGTALYEETITKIRGPIEKDNIISYSVNM
ncbi:MAG: glycosyltransferase, partial [Leptospiraceae bacterium]|nr:glycosyltransferase [Leptospiraceae bacterium]